MAAKPRNTSNTPTTPATATMTITIAPPSEETPSSSPESPPVVTLKLKSKSNSTANRHIHWSEDTVDNENLNKKKSNICCIFHPTESNDQDCSRCAGDEQEEQEIPAGKNVYEFQPQYNKKPK